MITIGSMSMSIPDATVKEIINDMMEMSRGVLHPIRGLFLRHYLSGQTRDHLPIGSDTGWVSPLFDLDIASECHHFKPPWNLQHSITFEFTNFIEINKLLVRLQPNRHSRDR